MRIISGYLKGRRIVAPANLPVRPTTDMAKESLFNILNNRIDFEEVTVLDLFTGIGSISFEMVSRGAKQVTAVDLNFKCVEFINKKCKELEIDNMFAIRSDVFTFLQRTKTQYDVIFADPPYELPNLQEVPGLILEKNLLKEGGILIVEHPQSINFSDDPRLKEHRKYGKVNFSFFGN